MKKLITILLLVSALLVITTKSEAAIALISNTCAGSSDNLSVTTSAINTTGATLIVLSISYYQGNGVATPTDSAGGNTWTQLTPHTISTSASNVLYYAVNPNTSATQTFTENVGASNYPSICVLAFSGTNTSSPFDVQNGATISNTALATGSVTPSSDNEVFIAGIGVQTTGTITINSSFTIPASGGQVAPAGNNYGNAIAYFVQGTAGALNPTFTNSGASGDLAASIATFKQAGATHTNTINNATINNGTIN